MSKRNPFATKADGSAVDPRAFREALMKDSGKMLRLQVRTLRYANSHLKCDAEADNDIHTSRMSPFVRCEPRKEEKSTEEKTRTLSHTYERKDCLLQADLLLLNGGSHRSCPLPGGGRMLVF